MRDAGGAGLVRSHARRGIASAELRVHHLNEGWEQPKAAILVADDKVSDEAKVEADMAEALRRIEGQQKFGSEGKVFRLRAPLPADPDVKDVPPHGG